MSRHPLYQGYQQLRDGPPRHSSHVRVQLPGMQPTRACPRTKHVYELSDTAGRAWATLAVTSKSPSATQLPVFLEGDRITGTFSLNLQKSHRVHDVVFSVKGRLVTRQLGPCSTCTFLHHSSLLWSSSSGHPHNLAVSDSTSSPAKFNGKLQGRYTWPLSFDLPREVTLPDSSGGPPRAFRLPHSFMERAARATIQYDIEVSVSRGRLRAQYVLRTMFVYVPAIRPDPPSLLRQIAYRGNKTCPCPKADPDGWKTFAPIKLQGTIFKTCPAELFITLSLATPLCYTRRTSIPCHLMIRCTNRQVLDLASSPNTINLSLRRHIKYTTSCSRRLKSEERVSWNDSVEDIASVIWWPSNSDADDVRHLCGEIRLDRFLQPTTQIAHFRVDYSVVLLPLKTAAFTPTKSSMLLEERVEIVTMVAKGLRPLSFMPPPPTDRTVMSDNYIIPSARGII